MNVREPQEGLRRHKLLPVEIKKSLPPLYSQDGKGMDAIVHLKLFSIGGRGTWYITEGEPDGDTFRFFGYCVSPLGPDCDEFGYFDFQEMASVKVFGSVPAIERDCYFDTGKMTVRECLEKNA